LKHKGLERLHFNIAKQGAGAVMPHKTSYLSPVYFPRATPARGEVTRELGSPKSLRQAHLEKAFLIEGKKFFLWCFADKKTWSFRKSR
jgi:hypothetical protein